MYEQHRRLQAGLEGISSTGLAVIGILCLLSVWSVYVSVERLVVFVRARRQSVAFARRLDQSRREDWLGDAIMVASHAGRMRNESDSGSI